MLSLANIHPPSKNGILHPTMASFIPNSRFVRFLLQKMAIKLVIKLVIKLGVIKLGF